MFVVLEMEPQINGHLLKMSLYEKLINSFSKQDKLLNRQFYKLSNDIYAAMVICIEGIFE